MGIKTKLCSLLLLMLMSFSQAQANDSDVALYIELVDGTTFEYAIGEDPRVTFDESNVLINSILVEFAIPKDLVQRFYFWNTGGTNTSITETPKSIDASFSFDGYTVGVTGAGKDVQVYDLSGHMLCNVATSQGSASIDISMFNAGIYIVRTNNQTIKILKK